MFDRVDLKFMPNLVSRTSSMMRDIQPLHGFEQVHLCVRLRLCWLRKVSILGFVDGWRIQFHNNGLIDTIGDFLPLRSRLILGGMEGNNVCTQWVR